MIALILATKKETDSGYSKSTLIGGHIFVICCHINSSPSVAPLSVLSNWEKQLEDHCAPGALTSCVYYGNNRGLSAAELQKYDVVITTYQTVAGEHNDSSAGP